MSDVKVDPRLAEIGLRATEGQGAAAAEALLLARTSQLDELLFVAGRVREAHFGNRLHCCSIVQARSGRCPENCSFCAQSTQHATDFKPRQPLDETTARDQARRARESGASAFGLVASGCGPAKADMDRYCELARAVRGEGMAVHASLGILDDAGAKRLAAAGVTVYNHNLETARDYFAEVCTTHDYDQRLATLEVAGQAGMQRCCGGIFGLGESWEHRVQLGNELASLSIERVPLNFLHPIAGTPLGDRQPLEAREALRIIAIFRLMLPQRQIQVCGGRELVLGSLQPLAFAAGATGVILGDYLATAGQSLEKDLEMFKDLGLELTG